VQFAAERPERAAAGAGRRRERAAGEEKFAFVERAPGGGEGVEADSGGFGLPLEGAEHAAGLPLDAGAGRGVAGVREVEQSMPGTADQPWAGFGVRR
jgi:hypothetical protein